MGAGIIHWTRWMLAIGAALIVAEFALLASGYRVLLHQKHIPENPDEAQEEAYSCTYFMGFSVTNVRLWAGIYDGCPWVGDSSLDEPSAM